MALKLVACMALVMKPVSNAVEETVTNTPKPSTPNAESKKLVVSNLARVTPAILAQRSALLVKALPWLESK